MPKITNEFYLQFKKEGLIKPISEEQILAALERIKEQGKLVKEARSLLILLYYTGARPDEALRIKSLDITKQDNYVIVRVPAAKHGLVRSIYLKFTKPLIRELWFYSSAIYPDFYIFKDFQAHYERLVKTKTGEIRKYISLSDKLRYHFKKWFPEAYIPPYFLRHSRFSKLAEAGATAEEIRQLKGAKTYDSVTPYMHMSSKSAKSLAKKMD